MAIVLPMQFRSGSRWLSFSGSVGRHFGRSPNETVLPARLDDRTTFAEGVEKLRDHLVPLEVQIEELVKLPVTQNAFDAMVSLAWNIGIGNFERSTLLKLLNAKNYLGAADALLSWTRAGGRYMPGLFTRRLAERELFLQS